MARSTKLDRPASRFVLDWMLVAVALIAAALVAGALIRVETHDADVLHGTSIGGLRSLAATERLVVFEDYNFDSGGWSEHATDRSRADLGGVLGPFPYGTELSREFELPDGTVGAVIGLDTLAWDGAALPTLNVRVNGSDLTSDQSNNQGRLIFDQTAPDRARIWIILDRPESSVTFTLANVTEDASWAVDNLTVYARVPAPPES